MEKSLKKIKSGSGKCRLTEIEMDREKQRAVATKSDKCRRKQRQK